MRQIGLCVVFFFFSSRRRHTRFDCDWSSDVCSSDLIRLMESVDTTRDLLAGVLETYLSQTSNRMNRVMKQLDRKSTRLNSSHSQISYAVFCLKKKKSQYDLRIQVIRYDFDIIQSPYI